MSRVEAPDWHLGEMIVLAAQEHHGVPDPSTWPSARLTARTRARQSRALGVWLGFADTLAVGHGLVDHAEAATWSGVDEELTAALEAGRLVCLGSLAVQPGWERRGVARALIEARLAWVARQGLVAVSEVWADSPGAELYESYGQRVGSSDDGAISYLRLG